MSFIKLKEYCKNHSVAYITGYRWFKNGQIPGAYQTDSGTILIPDNFNSNSKNKTDKIDAISLLLEKSIEFNNNDASIIDFTAYILSNFSFSLNESFNVPIYSKNKPKSEDIQKSFQKFIPTKEETDRLKTIKALIKDDKSPTITLNEFNTLIEESNGDDTSEVLDTATDLSSIFSSSPIMSELSVLYNNIVEGTVARNNVDFASTPQQINYTSSTAATDAFSNSFDQSNQSLTESKLYSSSSTIPLINGSLKALGSPRARRGRKPGKK